MSKQSPSLVLRPLIIAVAIALMAACSTTERTAAESDVAALPPPSPPPPPMQLAADSKREELRAAPKDNVAELQAAPVAAPAVGNIALSGSRPYAEPKLVVDSETYAHTPANPTKLTAVDSVSTFSMDVDTGSYTNTRRMLTQENRLPPADAVRAEEFINYFDYAYAQPKNRATPFSVTTELGIAPWNAQRELLLVGLQGYQMQKSEIPPANLVFLLDVSGSMDEPNKLPLLKASIATMVERMSARDVVSIVVYAGAAGVVLPPTRGDQHDTILAALNQLSAGGSTNGGEGIELAYTLARSQLIPNGVNRILLATDGDFNVGQFDRDQLKAFVAKQRSSGVTLSTLGFGAGNYNDAMAEQLADVGNGKYAYIDSINEASKVLGREIAGSLFTIAGDVKVQLEFNPAVVAEYRLIGYDNRMLAHEDFNNDKVDAGDIGAGHTVTALYEITRVGAAGGQIDPLRYGKTNTPPTPKSQELGFLKLRYKLPNTTKSVLLSQPISTQPNGSARLTHAAMVAAFAEHLQGGKYLGAFGLSAIEQQLRELPQPVNDELLGLVATARRLQEPTEVSAISR